MWWLNSKTNVIAVARRRAGIAPADIDAGDDLDLRVRRRRSRPTAQHMTAGGAKFPGPAARILEEIARIAFALHRQMSGATRDTQGSLVNLGGRRILGEDVDDAAEGVDTPRGAAGVVQAGWRRFAAVTTWIRPSSSRFIHGSGSLFSAGATAAQVRAPVRIKPVARRATAKAENAGECTGEKRNDARQGNRGGKVRRTVPGTGHFAMASGRWQGGAGGQVIHEPTFALRGREFIDGAVKLVKQQLNGDETVVLKEDASVEDLKAEAARLRAEFGYNVQADKRRSRYIATHSFFSGKFALALVED